MVNRIKTKSVFLGLSVILLAAILACGEGATPTPDAQPTQDVAAIVQQVLAQQEQPDVLTAADIQQLVQGVVTQALADQPAPEGLTAQQVQDLVQNAIAATIQPGASALEVQTAIAAAVGAIQPGVTAEDVQAVVQQAVTAALGTAGPTPAPGAIVEPFGTLDVSFGNLGPEIFTLKNQPYLAARHDGIGTHEYMFAKDPDGVRIPRLVTDLSVDASGLVYTFKLQEGATWHTTYGLWGQFTADDFIFSMENVAAPGGPHSRAGEARRLYTCDECEMVALDQFTVQLTRPTPSVDIWWMSSGAFGMGFHSKDHYEAVGEEAANTQSVGTGPWALVEYKANELVRLTAVRNHWRKTPEWDQWVWWEISEQSTRLANFLTGLLDSANLTAESRQAVKNANKPGYTFMSFNNASNQNMLLFGQQYFLDHPNHTGVDPKTPLADNAFDCSLAWVSCDADINSTAWDNARKVRLAMSMAIDRDALVSNLLGGDGNPFHVMVWMGHDVRAREFGLDQLSFEFDPDRARDLLTEAGFADGFDMVMNLAPIGSIEAGEAIATMWEDIGIRVELARTVYAQYRPTMVSRAAKEAQPYLGSTSIEPLQRYSLYFTPQSAFNLGFEHPVYEALLEQVQVTADDDARWALMADIARFVFDNVMVLPLYTENLDWPLGPQLGPWKVMGGESLGFLTNWEDATHK